MAIALSGGIDSVVLLDVLARLRTGLRLDLIALHVNHGLSPNAAQWEAHCREAADARGVAFDCARVSVARDHRSGLEGHARDLRHASLRRMAVAHGAAIIAFGHHADDQAETVLLQLLRGGAPRGLAAMGEWVDDGAFCDAREVLNPADASSATDASAPKHTRPTKAMRTITRWRPLLRVPRAAIASHATANRLQWIDDESNSDLSFRRNFLRAQLLPLLETGVPDYRAALARAAAFANESATLLAELAELDVRHAATPDGIDVGALRMLGAMRSINLLRHWLRTRNMAIPSADRVDEFIRQVVTTGAKASPSLALSDDVTLVAERGCIRIVVPGASFSARWLNERSLVFAHGELSFEQAVGDGIAATRVPDEGFQIRPRVPGARLKVSESRPRRTLKNLMQEAGIPGSLRPQWPLVMHGEEIVAVPGLGVGVDWQCPPGAPGWVVRWQPRTVLSA